MKVDQLSAKMNRMNTICGAVLAAAYFVAMAYANSEEPMDLARNNAYPTPFANTTVMAMLLSSLGQQKNAPKTATSFEQEYDYIIAGAGSAGSVLAGRLSEVPCASILLLEAGKPPPLISEVPGLAAAFRGTDLDWDYRTVKQKNTARRMVDGQVIWPSGRALGGTSSINGMFYIRGSSHDYDRWANHGALGWSFSDVRPYFLKLENNTDTELLANGNHVTGGPITAERAGYLSPLRDPIFRAAQDLGYKIVDLNSDITGFAKHQGTLRRGQRCGTAKAYLVPAENRENLDILPNAFVRKIAIENNRAVGVVFQHGGKVHEVKARKEVILSAGAVNSAQILMLSGIGPKEHLSEIGVPLVADLPVGENFHDHCGLPLDFLLGDSTAPEEKFTDPQIVQEYIHFRTGLLSALEGASVMGILNHKINPVVDKPTYQLYFVELAKSISPWQLGLNPEDAEQYYGPYMNRTRYLCMVHVMQPHSRGTVKLRSGDPRDAPLIDPNYFADKRDVRVVVEGLKTCQKIGTSPAMQEIGSEPLPTLMPGCENVSEDHYLECLARSVVVAGSHPVGTAKMGDPNDPATVVDHRLKVKGIEGLRVVDASIMPIVPSGNTNTPTIMVAEKASDMIKETMNCKKKQITPKL